jgi:hypothetical protein
MSEIDEHPVTADWLTDLLRAGGVLPHASVEAVDVVSSRLATLSRVRRLVVRYSGSTAAPTHIFLKTTRAGLSPMLRDIGQREVAYYRDVARYLPGGLVPRCYSAVWDDDTSRFSLLLEDLTATHAMISEWPVPPTDAQCRRIVRVYARLHACLWDHSDLGKTIGTFIDAPLTDWFNRYQQRFAAFADHLGDRLPPGRRRIYERAIACGDRLADRHRTRRDLTVVHGDAHAWNSLHSPDGDIRVIDWDSWRLAPATDDLAYMMAVHWYPERRQRLEDALLRHYHQALVDDGIVGYGLDALRHDYRHAVVRLLSVPVFQHSAKLPAAIWWSHLERIFLAFDDLGCEELLT